MITGLSVWGTRDDFEWNNTSCCTGEITSGWRLIWLHQAHAIKTLCLTHILTTAKYITWLTVNKTQFAVTGLFHSLHKDTCCCNPRAEFVSPNYSFISSCINHIITNDYTKFEHMVMAWTPIENVEFRGNWLTGLKVCTGARHMNGHRERERERERGRERAW